MYGIMFVKCLRINARFYVSNLVKFHFEYYFYSFTCYNMEIIIYEIHENEENAFLSSDNVSLYF